MLGISRAQPTTGPIKISVGVVGLTNSAGGTLQPTTAAGFTIIIIMFNGKVKKSNKYRENPSYVNNILVQCFKAHKGLT